MTVSRVPVLLYHSIGASGADGLAPWEMPRAVFATHMDVLDDHGYDVIALSHYASWLRDPAAVTLPARPVVVTFDDGYANFVEAAEVMADRSLPSTLFVATAYVDATSSWLTDPRAAREPMLTRAMLESLPALGVEIGAHAHDHVALDELSPDAVKEQVTRSKSLLEDLLGRRVTSFAYPFGYSDKRVRAAVAAAGYERACAVKDSLSAPFDDVFAIARVFAPATADVRVFEQALRFGKRPVRRHERVATKTWRAVRRVRSARRRAAARVSSTPG
jgi:peptidoglycan/xylan/chitin deacetylase (PgdA/CDA1 family)